MAGVAAKSLVAPVSGQGHGPVASGEARKEQRRDLRLVREGSSQISGSSGMTTIASAGVTRNVVWSVPICAATRAAWSAFVVLGLGEADRYRCARAAPNVAA